MRLHSLVPVSGLALGLFVSLGAAQSSSTSSTSSIPTSLSSASSTAPTSSFTLSDLNITTNLVVPLSTRSRALTGSTTVATTIHTTESIYLTPSSTSTTSTTSTSTTSASPSATTTAPPSIHLETRVDGAFACLGVLLVITGLPTAFLGHKNRWSSFFLLGFYTMTLACAVIILKFGVLDRLQNQTSLPDAKLRGLYLFACSVAGFVGGGIAIFFWQLTKYLIGALGGFAFGLWIQCMSHSGLVRPVGYRWLMFIGCAAVGFTLCTIPRLHYPVLLAATAMVGATAFILGVDCFTTAGLKEFYIWNLGYNKLFPKFAKIGFGVSQTMAIELGLIAAVALAGAAVQLRVLSVLRVRLRELSEEHRRHDEELEAQAASRFKDVEAAQAEWEKKHGRGEGSVSAAPLLTREAGTGTPTSESRFPDTPGTLVGGGRPTSSLFSFPGLASKTPMQPSDAPPQSPGALPALDLGAKVKDELPGEMISQATMIDDHPEIRQRTELLDEIQEIRKSLDALSHTGSGSRRDSNVGSGSGSMSRRDSRARYSSFGDFDKAVAAEATARVVADENTRRSSVLQPEPAVVGSSTGRERVRSMIHMPSARRPFSTLIGSITGSGSSVRGGHSTARPKSTPLADDDWETYVQERKLFQPPSGVTAPIPTSELPPALVPGGVERVPPSDAVLAALAQRQARESLFDPSAPAIPAAVARPSAEGESSSRPKSWFSMIGDRVASPTPPPAPSAGRAQSPTPSSRPSPLDYFTRKASAAQPPAQTPITVLGPVRNSSSRSPHSPPPAAPNTPPAERILSFEEYDARHKARLHALQNPLTKQENKEATLADARSRWERSKEIEGKVMARKQAQEQAALEERRRSKSPGPERAASPPAGAQAPGSPRGERRPSHRTQLSLDRLAASPPPRVSSSVKVEEWQKYQMATEEAARNSSSNSGNAGSSSRHQRRDSRRD